MTSVPDHESEHEQEDDGKEAANAPHEEVGELANGEKPLRAVEDARTEKCYDECPKYRGRSITGDEIAAARDVEPGEDGHEHREHRNHHVPRAGDDAVLGFEHEDFGGHERFGAVAK